MVAVYSKMINPEAYAGVSQVEAPQTSIDLISKDLVKSSLLELGSTFLSENIRGFIEMYQRTVNTGMRAAIMTAGQTLEKQISALEKKDFVERQHEMCVGVWHAARIVDRADLEDRALDLMVPKGF